jgi:putative ABC transport system permease protein
LDREYDALYRLEQRVGTLVQVFTGLAILVACFGLYGLASYSTVQRTKEIGVRKVLGATVASIVGMLSSEIFRLIVIAFVLAAPSTFYIADKWLSDFAYRIELEWWIFGMAALAATLMALLTNIQQSLRAALANPVEALRYE